MFWHPCPVMLRMLKTRLSMMGRGWGTMASLVTQDAFYELLMQHFRPNLGSSPLQVQHLRTPIESLQVHRSCLRTAPLSEAALSQPRVPPHRANKLCDQRW